MPGNSGKSAIVCLISWVLVAGLSELKNEQWKGSVTKEEGVEIIRNPKEPLFRETNSGFEHELTIRESESKNAFSFVRLSGLLIDTEDNIYALDSRDSNIKVFSARGQFIRTIGHQGQGPGELDTPVHMDFYSLTELAVQDAGNRRLTFFGLDGDYRRSVSTAKISMGNMKIDSTGNIFGVVIAFRNNLRRYELQKFDSSFDSVTTIDFADIKETEDLSFLTANPSFTITREGLIFYGCPDLKYEIRGYNSEGVLIKKIQKAFVPVRIPQVEKESVAKGVMQGREVYFPEYYPPYYNIEDNDNGKLIVLTRKYFKKRMYDFDIFDNEGKYLEAKRFIPGYKASYFKWKKDRLYVVEEEESGISEIKVYRVKWAVAKPQKEPS